MKKFYAIVLGLVMVLSLASIASAEFKISGQFVVKGVYDMTDGVDPAWLGIDYSSDTRFEIAFSATYENVSANMKFRLKDQDQTIDPAGLVPVSISDYVDLRTANMYYKFSDALSLGITEDVTGDLNVYESFVDSAWAWKYDTGDPYFRANIASGDFAASVITDLYENEALWLYGGGTYNLDPLTIGCAVLLDDDYYEFLPGVKYAISDELSVDGEVFYNEAEDLLVGAGINYATDALSVEGGFWYDLSDIATEDIANYFLYVSYSVTDNVDLYLNYNYNEATFNPADNDPGFEVGATLYLDSADKSSIDINYMEVDEDLTFTFKVKF